ncbi:MAG: hypothetical protein ACYCRF_11215 [Acidithiobacillus sp.]
MNAVQTATGLFYTAGAWAAIDYQSGGPYFWDEIDAYMQALPAGVMVWWTLTGVPDYLSPKPWVRNGFGNTGMCTVPPASTSELQAFITALINRYNVTGPGKGPITVIEVWNEPEQNSAGNPVTMAISSPGVVTYTNTLDYLPAVAFDISGGGTLPSGVSANTMYYAVNVNSYTQTFNIATSPNGTPIDFTTASTGSPVMDIGGTFWCGTPQDLANFALAIKAGIAASSDPQVLVSSPSFPIAETVLNATAVDSNGAQASTHWDVLSLHGAYSVSVPLLDDLIVMISNAQEIYTAAGLTQPIYITEFGNTSPGPYDGSTPQEIAADMMHRMQIGAEMGIAGMFWYYHDAQYNVIIDNFENNAYAAQRYTEFANDGGCSIETSCTVW